MWPGVPLGGVSVARMVEVVIRIKETTKAVNFTYAL
jgi:hypothetical protein